MLETLKPLLNWCILLLLLPLIGLNVWLLARAFEIAQPLITIFIVANLLAFILDFPVQLLQAKGVKREYGILMIVLFAFAILGIFAMTGAPLLLAQLTELTTLLPSWIQSGSQQIQDFDTWLENQNLPGDLSGVAQQFNELIPNEIKLLPNQILNLILSLTDRVIDGLLTAVFTFYLLLHGQAFWTGLFARFPFSWGDKIRSLFRQQFQNYFLGQVAIALVMSLILSTVFFVLHIPYWLVFGMGIGLASLIPFGDLVGIMGVSLLVSLKSISLGGEVLVVSLLTDQLIDNAIAPRLLGRLVGLNPIWVLISLIVGAQIGDLIGVLIAVPCAAAINAILETSLPVLKGTPDISA